MVDFLLPDPLEAITSSKYLDRLYAVRELARNLTPDNQAILLTALRREDNVWVKTAIRDALAPVRKNKSKNIIGAARQLDLPLEEEAAQEAFEEAERLAIAKVSRTFAHEISGVIGRLKFAAANEFVNYDASQSKREIELLSNFTDVLADLQEATKTPNRKDYKITELTDLAALGIEPTLISLAGNEAAVFRTDKTLFQLAYINGIRNALEAVQDLPQDQRHIVVNWGQNDIDSWVSINDNGVGLANPDEDYFKFGKTTKTNGSHFGSGLCIAENAMRSLGGSTELKPKPDVGAIYKITWPKDS